MVMARVKQKMGDRLFDVFNYALLTLFLLAAAYPLYSWKILFRQKKFVGIMYSDDEYPILPTDSIIIRSVTVEEILKAKACLQKHRPDINSEIILYELNNKNITKFKDHEYKEIFAR